MYLAILETRNFVFHAIGDTEEGVMDALKAGLTRHSEETGADLEYLMELISYGDAKIMWMHPGDCRRDYEPI